MKQTLKQIIKDVKEYIKYLKYKSTLPRNPMHDDIYVVEFPKSGITWISHMLGNIELLLNNSNEKVTFFNQHKYVVDIHQIKGSNIKRTFTRTFIKSHDQYNPYYFFVVYLIRNPFDTMVSYYNYMVGFGYEKSFKEFIQNENTGIESWVRHINSWYYKKNDPQKIHFIKYENLLINPNNEIRNLYLNLGLELDNEIIDQALDYSCLKNMKTMELHYAKFNPNRTLNFVGKEKKIKKEVLLTKDLELFIFEKTKNELKVFYPEIYEKYQNDK